MIAFPVRQAPSEKGSTLKGKNFIGASIIKDGNYKNNCQVTIGKRNTVKLFTQREQILSF